MNAFYAKYIRLVSVAGLVVVADQITKTLILKSMPLYHSVTVIPGFFNLVHIQNPGGAFGFLANQSSALRTVVFLFISSLAVGLVFWFYKNTPKTHPWLATAFAMIFGGAIGNLIDRIRFGKVIDFLDFYLGDLHWHAFNIADSAISVGITVFIFHLLFKKLPE
ncbi:MAG: signal peptidase II [Thermodesulfobacteriota bacterium]|nr:signal peptidase II [Thermodesulfobacteriota bacterium]